MIHKQKYFIEQFRNINKAPGVICQTRPTEIAYLKINLDATKLSTTLKTVAVWIITPKTTIQQNESI